MIGNYDKKAQVEYIPNIWIKSHIKGTKLFVFDTIKNAQYWRAGRTFQIWECEVSNPASASGFLKDIQDLLKWFRQKRNKKKLPPLNNLYCPIGAIAVDSLKLTKLVG